MCSFSRHSSIDPVNTNSTANSQSEAKSIDPVNTNSTANSHSEAKSIDPVNINPTASSQPESMNMENKSLQSSLENNIMSNDECSSQDTNDHISTENNRPVSAVLSRKKNTFQFDSRPQSARVYSQNRTANSVVIDMTNLQSVEDT